MPSLIKILFKTLYKLSPKFLCEMCSLFMSFNLMSWLVGTSERYSLFPSTNTMMMMMSNSSSNNSNSDNIIQSYIVNDNSINIINEDNSNLNIYNSTLIVTTSTTTTKSSIIDSRDNDDKNNLSKQWRSGVKLLECRYLKESGCKSACIYLCKGPTQQFFRDELGQLL